MGKKPDVWDYFEKKDRKEVTIPSKPSKPSKPAKTKPKPRKSQVSHVQAQPQERVHFDPSAFIISSIVDESGIHVITKYLNEPIHHFVLTPNDYQGWIRANHLQKSNFVFSRTNSSVFPSAAILQSVINRTIKVIDSIFAKC